ncbi:MAG: MerR family copper efflux transcriptional regulator [Janthinobacterium sp.]|jgi:MerR family copper efflux transcriptional regulator
MNIGQAASETGISAKMIRHYESIALIKASARSSAGYRIYGAGDLHALHFIKRARTFGFSLEHIRELLSLWQNDERASVDVKSIADAHVAQLDSRIAEMRRMRDTLVTLARSCQGDAQPDCPILQELGLPDGWRR